MASSNYDDSIKKVTGGRNGFGAKLTNIFSKKFEIECADSKNKKLYKQVFKNNMSVIGDPTISEFSPDAFDYTSVTFEPDLKKFNMKRLDDDICALFKKRVYDLAGCSPSNVNVYFNGKKVQVKNFQTYVDLYHADNSSEDVVKIYDKVNQRWEVCLSSTDCGSF